LTGGDSKLIELRHHPIIHFFGRSVKLEPSLAQTDGPIVTAHPQRENHPRPGPHQHPGAALQRFGQSRLCRLRLARHPQRRI